MNTKLRFYLRGLGVGLVVTTLILMAVRLNTRGGQMTDAEIKARAAELGMVEGNSYSLTDAVSDSENGDGKITLNTDVLDEYNTDKPSETESFGDADILVADKTEDTDGDKNADADENADAEVTDGDAADAQEAEAEEGAEADADVEDDTVAEDTTADAGQAEANDTTTDTDAAENEDTTADTGAAVGSATITIASGSASETAAAVLEKAGVITDAKDFNSYMCKNGYDRRIHPGTYTIEKGATYEEICKIIAG